MIFFPTLANAAFFFVSFDRLLALFSSHVVLLSNHHHQLESHGKKILTPLSIFFCALLSHSLECSFSLIMFFAASRALSSLTCTYICFLTVIEKNIWNTTVRSSIEIGSIFQKIVEILLNEYNACCLLNILKMWSI
jgi:hypothetical protein